MMLNSCHGCGFNDPDFGCTCPSYEMWYACPLSPEPTEEDFQRMGMKVDWELGSVRKESE